MNRILIAEDEKAISDLLKTALTKNGYDCRCVYDGSAAADAVDREIFDLALLDVMLPEIDGFALMDYIRPLALPVIFITAKGTEDDRVRGLKLGAEDYIVKPFMIRELLARVEVVLRRYNKGDSVICCHGICIDTVPMVVTREGVRIELTHKEYELLLLFARNKGVALSRTSIYLHVWGADYPEGSKTVDLHIQRLRKKTGLQEALVPVHKVGYRMEP